MQPIKNVIVSFYKICIYLCKKLWNKPYHLEVRVPYYISYSRYISHDKVTV
jgi:hypothetical protein